MSETTQHKSPRVQLRPNLQKILAAITHVIATAEKQQLPIKQYDILKTLFIADKSHLNVYGRPITFDNYYAMRAGPVPSLAYELLKENKRVLKNKNIPHLPWDRTLHGGRYYYSRPNIVQFHDVLSDSDKLALSNAWNVIQSLTFKQIRALTHNDPAYIEAWDESGTGRSYKMSYGMFFDSPDFEKAETIEFLSKHT